MKSKSRSETVMRRKVEYLHRLTNSGKLRFGRKKNEKATENSHAFQNKPALFNQEGDGHICRTQGIEF